MMVHQRTYKQPKGEVNTLPSMTVPGQTLPIRTLVERYRRNADVAVFNGVYNDGAGTEGLDRLDKVERAQLALELKQNIKSQRAQLLAAAKKEIEVQKPDQGEAINSLDV